MNAFSSPLRSNIEALFRSLHHLLHLARYYFIVLYKLDLSLCFGWCFYCCCVPFFRCTNFAHFASFVVSLKRCTYTYVRINVLKCLIKCLNKAWLMCVFFFRSFYCLFIWNKMIFSEDRNAFMQLRNRTQRNKTKRKPDGTVQIC